MNSAEVRNTGLLMVGLSSFCMRAPLVDGHRLPSQPSTGPITNTRHRTCLGVAPPRAPDW